MKKQMSNEYAAGLLDGEGYIGIRKYKSPYKNTYRHHYHLIVKVGNTNEEVIRIFKDKYSGTFCIRKLPSGKYFFETVLCGPTALKFLKGVRPYIIIKRERVKLAVAYQELVAGKWGQRARKSRFKKRISELNG